MYFSGFLLLLICAAFSSYSTSGMTCTTPYSYYGDFTGFSTYGITCCVNKGRAGTDRGCAHPDPGDYEVWCSELFSIPASSPCNCGISCHGQVLPPGSPGNQTCSGQCQCGGTCCLSGAPCIGSPTEVPTPPSTPTFSPTLEPVSPTLSPTEPPRNLSFFGILGAFLGILFLSGVIGLILYRKERKNET